MTPPGGSLPGTALPETHRCDVVVLGDSLAAIVAAERLATSGASVIRLSRGPQALPPDHGVLFHGLSEHVWRLMSSLGTDATQALYTTSARGIAHLASEPGVVVDQAFWAAVDEREVHELGQSEQALAELGRPSELLSASAANAALGTQHLHGALRLPGEGAIERTTTARALSEAAARAGVQVVEASPVSIEQDASGLLLPCASTSVRAELVVCADAWRLRDLDPWFADKLSPWREQAVRFSTTGERPLQAMRAGYAYTFARTQPDGRTLVAGARWASPHLQTGETDPSTLDPTVQSKLDGFASRFLPHLASTPEERWAWIETKGCDGLPVLGPLPGRARVVSLCGFSGNSSALGVGCALAVADSLLGVGQAPLPSGWSTQRFV